MRCRVHTHIWLDAHTTLHHTTPHHRDPASQRPCLPFLTTLGCHRVVPPCQQHQGIRLDLQGSRCYSLQAQQQTKRYSLQLQPTSVRIEATAHRNSSIHVNFQVEIGAKYTAPSGSAGDLGVGIRD